MQWSCETLEYKVLALAYFRGFGFGLFQGFWLWIVSWDLALDCSRGFGFGLFLGIWL